MANIPDTDCFRCKWECATATTASRRGSIRMDTQAEAHMQERTPSTRRCSLGATELRDHWPLGTRVTIQGFSGMKVRVAQLGLSDPVAVGRKEKTLDDYRASTTSAGLSGGGHTMEKSD